MQSIYAFTLVVVSLEIGMVDVLGKGAQGVGSAWSWAGPWPAGAA